MKADGIVPTKNRRKRPVWVPREQCMGGRHGGGGGAADTHESVIGARLCHCVTNGKAIAQLCPMSRRRRVRPGYLMLT